MAQASSVITGDKMKIDDLEVVKLLMETKIKELRILNKTKGKHLKSE
jgi:hypothetical protein